MKKLRVLVVDDSAYNRQTLAELIASHPELEVAGKAADGEDALKLVSALQPDLITLDIEMPRMDGFTFLRLLMATRPTPVIVISSHSRKQDVFQALELGALDFIAKPTQQLGPDLATLKGELLQKALIVRGLEPMRPRAMPRGEGAPAKAAVAPTRARVGTGGPVDRVVCIGASTGGPPALESLFRALGPSPTTVFLVAQHMPPKFTKAFADRLNRTAQVTIQEGEDGMRLTGGSAYVAPGGRHTVVAQRGAELVLSVSDPEAADRYVPSVDRLFTSAASLTGVTVMGVVLTGMGSDGSAGIKVLHGAGARTVAESRDTAIVFGMPNEAIQTGAVDEVLALEPLIERVRTFAAGAEASS